MDFTEIATDESYIKPLLNLFKKREKSQIMKRWAFIITLLVISFGTVLGQGRRGLRLELDTQHILIGDQIKMTLEMYSGPSDKVTLPIIGDTLIKEIEVVSREMPDTTLLPQQAEKIIRQQLILTAWDSGVYTVPPLVGTINGDSAYSPQSYDWSLHLFPIDSTNAITDIKGNRSHPLTLWDYVKEYGPYVLIYWLILTALFLLWMYFKKRRKKIVEQKEPQERIPSQCSCIGAAHAARRETTLAKGQTQGISRSA